MPHVATLCEAVRVFEREHESQGCERSNARDLPEQRSFPVGLLADSLNLMIHRSDLSRQLFNHAQH